MGSMNGVRRKWGQLRTSWRLGDGVSGRLGLARRFWKLSRPAPAWHPERWITLPLRLNGTAVALTLRDLSSDMIIFREIFVDGDYDAVGRLSWRPRVIYDLGANAGLAAVFLHGKFPGARIIGFEPGRSEHRVASRNYAALGQDPPYPVAVWDRAGEVAFLEAPELSGGQHLIPGEAGGRTVRAVRLDEFIREEGLPVPDLVKMDIEGAEAAALRGLGAFLREVRGVLLETHGAALHGECRDILEAAGLEVRHDEPRHAEARILLAERNG